MAVKRKAAKGGLKAARAMPGKRAAGRRGVKLGARAAKRNAYLQAVLHNERVHERVRTGVGSARAAYGRVSRRGKGADDLVADRRARRDFGRALVAFQEAVAAIRGAKVRRRRRIGVRAILPVMAIGGAGAVVLNEGLRQRVIGLVSGSSNGSGPAAGGSSTTSGSGGAVEPSAAVENAPPTVRED
ncbi:MAG: hypothetical protein H0T96_09030 [Thermoleophilaceae bacterium]|nr:hypothetical protein [Thermoleophilaceae bacterium]